MHCTNCITVYIFLRSESWINDEVGFRGYDPPSACISSFDDTRGEGIVLAGTKVILLVSSAAFPSANSPLVVGHTTVMDEMVSNSCDCLSPEQPLA